MSKNFYNFNQTWTNEKNKDVGYYLEICVYKIRLDTYDLPVTKWSGGGSVYYTFDEFTENSEPFNKVKSCFDESVALNVLHIIQNKSEIPKVKEYENNAKVINDWLSKFQQTDNLLQIWKSLPHYDFIYPYDDRFIEYNIEKIEINNELREAKFIDKEWNTIITIGHQNSQFQKAERKGTWKVYLVGNWKLIVLCNILGEVVKLEHLKPIEKVFKNFYGELEGIKKIDNLVLISFTTKRLNPELGSYILALNPLSGKLIYQNLS